MREYVDLVDDLVRQLDGHTVDTAVELAELPDMVRGYEDIKLASVERYRDRMAELREQLVR